MCGTRAVDFGRARDADRAHGMSGKHCPANLGRRLVGKWARLLPDYTASMTTTLGVEGQSATVWMCRCSPSPGSWRC